MGWEVPPRGLFSSHPSSRRWGREARRGRAQPYIPRQNQEDRFTVPPTPTHTHTPQYQLPVSRAVWTLWGSRPPLASIC